MTDEQSLDRYQLFSHAQWRAINEAIDRASTEHLEGHHLTPMLPCPPPPPPDPPKPEVPEEIGWRLENLQRENVRLKAALVGLLAAANADIGEALRQIYIG